ncbi:hypothetical protein DPMN_101597 [Dreissena polymorpha]|uniref:Uncharacterized protein n=1 Tax=Dreissena polymorpha TaxID=45954 RepID=A0A9D4LHT9_DREPO|nr:hypothetical protein DPMN_101597 [Dreissena polymorpha]
MPLNRCTNEEIQVKGNFGWAWPMWAGRPRIDRIVIRETTNDSALATTLAGLVFIIKICTYLYHFDLIQDIIGTNLLTKFHDDQTINVASRVLTRKNAEPTGSHVFQPISIIFELVQDIIGMNLLTIFHEYRKQKWPLNRGFQANVTIFILFQDIIETNLLTKFNEALTINVASKVFTRKNAPPPGGRVFIATIPIFELIQYIIGTNLLTKFHKDQTINVASRMLTRKNALPTGSHVFQPISIIFELVQDIIGMNLLTIFHEYRKQKWPLNRGFQANTNLLTKFNEALTINVASKVFTRKNAPPPGGHVFIATIPIFELIQYIIWTNLLTKFHKDQTINMASRMLTGKNALPPGSHVFQPISIIF